MPAALKKVLIVLLSLLMLATGLLLSLAGTEQGTRVLAEQARRWSGGALDWELIEGRLLGPLRLQGLRLQQPELALDLQALALDWRPIALLNGRLQIERLEAEGIRIEIAATEEPPESSEPFRVADLSLPLEFWVQGLRVENLELRTGDQTAQQIDELELVARLDARQLWLQRLALRTPDGGLEAQGRAELSEALPLRLNLNWDWRLPDQRLAAGSLRLRGDARNLSIEHRGGGELPIALQASIRDLLGRPSWELELSWPELTLSADQPPLVLGPGRLQSVGGLDDYRIETEGQISGAGLGPSRWSGRARGNAEGLHLEPLELISPPARLGLEGNLDWSGPFAFDLGYRAAGEGLAELHPELPERLDAEGRLRGRLQGEELTLEGLSLALRQSPLRLDLRGNLRLPAGAEPAVDGRLQWSALQWPPIDPEPLVSSGTGSLELSGSAADYRLALAAELSGSDFPPGRWELEAKGDQDRLVVQRLAGTLLDGRLQGDGELQWAPAPAGRLALEVAHLVPAPWVPDWPPGASLNADLRLELSDSQLRLGGLDLAIPEADSRLAISGRAELTPELEPTAFEARLDWSGLHWPPLAPAPELTSPEGQLKLAGTPDAYRFDLDAALAGAQIPPSHWQGSGQGDRSGLVLEPLTSKLLGGELRLSGLLGWAPSPRWDLQASGHGLDPGQWLPELAGRLGLALSTSGRIDAERALQADFDLKRLGGELAGRELSLSARGLLAGESLTLRRLQLDSGGNRIIAEGGLSARRLALNWQLEIPEPGALLPGAGGRLEASGRLEGSPERPSLQAKLRGQDLTLDANALSRLEADLQAGLGSDAPLRLDLSLGSLRDGERLLLQAASLQGRGTTGDHWLALDLQGPAERLRTRLEGGLDPALWAWNGRLADLNVESAEHGDWRLALPAALALATESLSLGEACLQPAAGAARVCAQADWRQTQGGSLAARLQSLELSRLLPDLSGEISGDLETRLAADGALQGQGWLEVSPGQLRVAADQEMPPLAHGGGRLDLRIGAEGLAAEFQLRALERGSVQAEVQLPRLNRLPLAELQPLSGRIRAELPDLVGLQAWVPELEATAGSLSADLRLAGSLDAPQVLGELRLANGAADIPLAGLELRQIELRIRDNPEQPGQLALTGGLVSGPGRADLDGRLDPASTAFELSLKGDNLQVYNTPDARALASPDLRIGWSDQVLRLRGRVLIPEAAITPKLGLSPSLLTEESAAEIPGQIVAPSADVVVLSTEGKPLERPRPAPPIQLDSQIELILGDRVDVNAVGFISRIAGNVTFTNRPGQPDLIPEADGRLLIEDGTFRAFGQNLEIETGQVIFARVPVTEPELNIRAARWIDNDPQISAAGVLISGPATEPLLELFSRPQLDPSEIQSYLLTGRSASARDSVLSIGTYLHSKLYVGYGYNLLEKTNEFDALYIITPRYGVEANVGEADNSLNLTFTHER